MLTIKPQVGDRVIAVYTRDFSSRTCRPVVSVTVEKVGKKYLWIDGDKFEFDGRGAGNTTGYELFDSEEAYSRHLQRDRNITKIRQAVSSYSFGYGLSDEALEQIVELIEVKNVKGY